MMPMSYQASCLISNLKKSGTQAAQSQRKLSLERITKRRQSLPVLPSYLSLLTMTSNAAEKKVKAGKQRKGVKFPLSVLMQQAVTDGDVQEIRQLITEHGMGAVEEREPSGLPPVMRAIFEGQLGCLKLLIDAGADVTVRDPENWTALHVAAAMDDVEAAEMILSSCKAVGDLLQTKNVDDERPVDLAESVEMARLLLHADLRELRADKAVESQTTSDHASADSEDAVIQLVHNHCQKYPNCSALDNVLKSNTCFDSLLHLAATKNYPHLADYLCRHHLTNLEARDRRGWTALHTAAYYNSVDIVLVLAEYGANTHALTHLTYEKPCDLTEHELIHTILEDGRITDSL